MTLPFREIHHNLLNINPADFHRLKHSKKCFEKDYTVFMEDLFAEEIFRPDTKNSSWYIPHYGEYEKNKIRVVLDCSAKYKGKSLNNHLLQGPDLINILISVLCMF